MKSLIINNEILEKYDITIEELLVLYKKSILNLNINNLTILGFLEEKGFIKIIDYNNYSFEFRQKAINLLDLLTVNIDIKENKKIIIKKSDRLINQEIDVDSFRQKWKGLLPGAMGSHESCKEKLHRWMKENPKYSFEDILKAADIYIKSLNDYKYLQRADYFIYKKEGKEESSRLSSFIDEIDNFQNEDWTTTLK